MIAQFSLKAKISGRRLYILSHWPHLCISLIKRCRLDCIQIVGYHSKLASPVICWPRPYADPDGAVLDLLLDAFWEDHLLSPGIILREKFIDGTFIPNPGVLSMAKDHWGQLLWDVKTPNAT